MPLPLFLLIVALELLVAISILVPTALPGRFSSRPQLGILVWLTSFAVAITTVVVAVTMAIWIAATEYLALSKVDLAHTNLPSVILASFAPWLLLALAGISLVLANGRLQHIGRNEAELSARLEVAARSFDWQGVRVLVTPVAVPLAGVMRGRVIISEPVDALPPPQRDAVLWHELAHIRLKHGAVRTLSRLVTRLFPKVSAALAMRSELDRLSELAADAWAARRCDPEVLLSARAQFQEFLPTSVR